MPNYQDAQTTLVEVASGRSLRLLEPGTRSLVLSFSRDGRVLVFDRFIDISAVEILRVDLRSSALEAKRSSSGLRPVPSPDGTLIVFTRRQVQGPTLGYVLLRDGSEKRLAMPAEPSSLSWSPDGRWLTYSEPFKGDSALMAQVVVDTSTWQERTVGYTAPCGCDGSNRARWSADSRYFLYSHADKLGTAVVEAGVWQPRPAPANSWWSHDGRAIFAFTWTRDRPQPYDFIRFDPRTGAQTTLVPRTDSAMASNYLSPDETRYVVEGAWQTVDIASLDGRPRLAGLEGQFHAWSQSGRYLFTTSSNCNGIIVYSSANGSRLACLERAWVGAFSPDDTSLAFLRITALTADPRFATAPVANDLYVLDLTTGVERRLLSDIRGNQQCLLWSPDSRWLAVAPRCPED